MSGLDEQRQDLINHLAGLQIPVKAVLIVEDRSAYEGKKSQVQLNVPLSVIDYRHVEEQAAQI